jgi:hypothetical protein
MREWDFNPANPANPAILAKNKMLSRNYGIYGMRE